jgi:ribonuclease P/MRP protein subunit RPP1
MPFYDLHVHTALSIGENTVDEVVEMAKRLGLSGLGIVRYYTGRVEKIPERKDIDLVSAMIIKPDNGEELDALAKKIRNKVEILMVHGGSYDINRAACENSMIDILCHPELGRRDSGLDHICVKSAQENNVAIEINFREILESYKRQRVYILSSMMKNIKLCNKYNAHAVTTSGAVTKWGLRSGRELAAITNLFGLDLGKAIASVSTIPTEIVTKNREKLANKRWEGVNVIEE